MALPVRISQDAQAPHQLFAENTGFLFEIHPPQRRFKWKKRQIEQLAKDIISAVNDNRDSYFLGTLLLAPLDGGRFSVIDGQQRITTLSILLAVLRDYCKQFDDFTVRAGRIQSLISRVDIDGNPTGSLVVKLQDKDNLIYRDLVEEYGSTSVKFSHKGELPDAVAKLKDCIDEHIGQSDRQRRLRDLSDYVLNKIKLLPIEVRNQAEGYLVFDTTNTRGLRLSPSEDLKARLATIAREDTALSNELIRRWDEAATKLENATASLDAMDDYLHAIWSSIAGHTPKRSLERIATKLTDPGKLTEFVKDLQLFCESYLAVVAPDGHSSLSEDLKDLNHLNIQSHSFLMMAHRFYPNRFKEAVDLVLSLQMRNVTLGPDQANVYEKRWPNWAMDVRNKEINKAFAEMRNLLVADDEFELAMAKAVVPSTAIVRHILRRLDPVSTSGSGLLPSEVDVEHIFPKAVIDQLKKDKTLSPRSKTWIQEFGYQIPDGDLEKQDLLNRLEPFLNRLGNQALLNNVKNRGVKNKSFKSKKEFYESQALAWTKGLLEYDTWGENQIAARQEAMARQAPDLWPK